MNPLVFFAQNPIIATERLHLRPLTLTDLVAYHEYTSDDQLLKYDYPAHASLAESLESLVVYNLAQPLGKYGIELKASGKLIGNIALKYKQNKLESELGYTINGSYHNQGFATEASRGLITLAKKSPLKVLVATVDSRNYSSQKVLLKLAFKETSRGESLSSRQEKITKINYQLDL